MIQKGSRPSSEITIEQIRAARALLGWSQTELAERAGLSLPTVKRVEINSDLRVSSEARQRLRVALEEGVSNSSTKTAEAPVYGYAKRPRTRAANRLNRRTPQLAKRSQFFCCCSGTAGWGWWRPGVRLKRSNKGERPQVGNSALPFGETNPNSSMITWDALKNGGGLRARAS